MLQSYGITNKPTTIKTPQANAFVERIHLVIADSIRSMQLHLRPFDDTTIDSVIQAVAFAPRSTHHTPIQSSPGQLVFGRDMIINATYIANWREIRQRQKEKCPLQQCQRKQKPYLL